MPIIEHVMLTLSKTLRSSVNSDVKQSIVITEIEVQIDKLYIRGGTLKIILILSCGKSELYGNKARCTEARG